MHYYENLKDIREDKGLTQKEIADILKTDQSYYSKYERGIRPLPIDHLKKLCNYYGISADYILGLPKNLKWPRD